MGVLMSLAQATDTEHTPESLDNATARAIADVASVATSESSRPLADLRIYDMDREFALAIARTVGIDCWTHARQLSIGGVSVELSLEVDESTLISFFAVHSGGLDRRTLALHEVFAATVTGRLSTVAGPEARRSNFARSSSTAE